jgi:hypothetical protein
MAHWDAVGIAIALGIIAGLTLAALYLWRLFCIIGSDGYILRASSGLPRDWSPSPDLPSTPYTVKPHH